MKKSIFVFLILFAAFCGILCGWRWGFDRAVNTAQLVQFPNNGTYVIQFGSGDGVSCNEYIYE